MSLRVVAVYICPGRCLLPAETQNNFTVLKGRANFFCEQAYGLVYVVFYCNNLCLCTEKVRKNPRSLYIICFGFVLHHHGLPFIRSGQNHLARHCEGGGEKTRQTEEEVGRQHQEMDRPGVRQVPEDSWEQGKMNKKMVAKSSRCPNDPRG